jgi:glycosyltransferase involved in cell wall biosynthesis
MHVLFIPKWYPGRNDPQLGDFLRKQALAAGAFVRMSVLFVCPVAGLGSAREDELTVTGGTWELHVHYRKCEHPWRAWSRVVNLGRYLRAVRHGLRRAWRERGRPDLVHAYIMVRPAVVAWWLKLRHGIPFVIGEQSSEYLDGTFSRKGALFAWWSRFLFRRAAAVTAVSAWLGDRLVQLGLCERYHVVPNVVPGFDRPLPAPGPVGHFMMVADLVDRTKNVSGVLRALANVRTTIPGVRLSIIGDGPDRAMLEALVGSLGSTGSVRFLGRLPNHAVIDHLAEAFAVVVNSRVETFSVVTGEALVQGRPVIATRCGGPQAFVNEVNGILVPVEDDAALAAAMRTLIERAHEHSPERIRASVAGRFSAEAVGRALATVYKKVLNNGEH